MQLTRNELIVDLFSKGDSYPAIADKLKEQGYLKISRQRVHQILCKELPSWKWLNAGIKGLPQKIRKEVLTKGQFECADCGKREDLVISNLSFHREGKEVKLDNLEILCLKCNVKKFGKK